MPKVRALRSSATHKAGDVFECDDIEARIFTAPDALGGPWGEMVSEPPRQRHRFDGSAVDRQMKAEESAPLVEDVHEAAVEPRKGRYNRRDMRAKDE